MKDGIYIASIYIIFFVAYCILYAHFVRRRRYMLDALLGAQHALLIAQKFAPDPHPYNLISSRLEGIEAVINSELGD